MELFVTLYFCVTHNAWTCWVCLSEVVNKQNWLVVSNIDCFSSILGMIG